MENVTINIATVSMLVRFPTVPHAEGRVTTASSDLDSDSTHSMRIYEWPAKVLANIGKVVAVKPTMEHTAWD